MAKTKKQNNEIDEIFKSKSVSNESSLPKVALTSKKKDSQVKKKKTKDNPATINKVETVVFSGDTEKQAMPKDDFFQDSRGERKITDDGLPIYLDTELNIGLGKDTEDCPFDCDCCF